jgi:flagellum-specific peptidoglycan hydrolase FlgJ
MRVLLLTTVFVIAPLIGGAQTLDSVRTYINDSNLQHKDDVLAQAVLETGWFGCSSCSMDKNNLFGWFYKGKYLKFDTWQKSIDYYVWWQRIHYKGGDYHSFLKRIGFATAKNYSREIKKIKVKLKEYEQRRILLSTR